MLNTKLNLYNPDWIELVFANRNKSYGAFDLRRHYGDNMVKAMGMAFTSVIAAALLYNFSLKKVEDITPKVPGHEIEVRIDKLKIEPPKEPVKPAAPEKPTPPVATTRLVPMVVTSEPVTSDPPRNIDITGEIGPITAKGTGTVAPVEDLPVTTGGGGVEPVVDNTIHGTGGLEFMPEPVGGAAAWSKFLNKNLHFPTQAQDAGKGGRVLVSFVIEKDGRLSDITVQNGAGYGMDEEAVRVLKLAKPWKPGMQNGQPVRVRYTIPMNFQLSEE
ncbi:energy transducer TonB [Mucilaginibacter sp. 14171R-50]|uniref:energy transducer TonB n=1 Tax=Mucilaginibacter sp. 14171R-50 TaxID=2703789 RepID=UPI00138CDECF|nr:energy transducer TonB [Mucilaginibacter sp. 14171R-50]QHS57391.1 energy transducer TonB [Mucilaginibacter sp. 14171R-50]